MRRLPLFGLATVCLLAALAGYFGWRHFRAEPPRAPALSFTDLDGTTHSLAQWRGRPVLLNFWATWCAPCLREIPMLMQAQRELAGTGLVILGPAVDSHEAVRRFRAEQGINYPVFAGADQAMAAMEALGDRRGALPWSVLLGADGRILQQHAGELDRATLERWLSDLDKDAY